MPLEKVFSILPMTMDMPKAGGREKILILICVLQEGYLGKMFDFSPSS
jgi:hypothetical protein